MSPGTDDHLVVCPTADLDPGDRKIVEKDNISIGVFNVDGEYMAIVNSCPHQQGPLCEGEMSPIIDAEFKEVGDHIEEFYRDDEMVICPWHNWAFNLRTGENVGDSSISLPTFDIIEEDGVLYVPL